MRPRRRRCATVLPLALLLPVAVALPGALSRPASAQLSVPRASDEAEVPLPDTKAIERGGRTRASVSFGGPNVEDPGQPAGGAPAQNAAATSDSVRRIAAPAGSDTSIPPVSSAIYGLDSLGGETGAMRPGQMPEQHVVKKGETLTSVCEQYFGDPWCWPRLWSENPQVTNPHWIFPGDVLRLRAGNGAAVAPRPAAAGMRLTSNRKGFDNKAVLLREIGFIDKDALAESARITGSREEKIMLATGDQAYVGFSKDKPLRAGDRYSVFVADTKNPIRAPDSGEVLGYLVRVYGDIVVDQVADRNTARGTLIDLAEPVERGYGVSPKVRLFRQIEPRPSTVSLEARVVAAFSPTIMLAAENFVVLSRGARDGLSQGNRGFVVRRGDGYRPIMEGWQKPDTRFPKEVVAELWIMDVREGASVAWVARSSKELRVGEFAELRKGH
jgi:hypothetical protein